MTNDATAVAMAAATTAAAAIHVVAGGTLIHIIVPRIET